MQYLELTRYTHWLNEIYALVQCVYLVECVYLVNFSEPVICDIYALALSYLLSSGVFETVLSSVILPLQY